jgi:hypothetical protein
METYGASTPEGDPERRRRKWATTTRFFRMNKIFEV